LYKPFKKFFESNYPYILKTDLARILIVKEMGGIYLDSDYMLIRDMEEVISKYD
jgi:mannosyltransferase OCH1-like enzyme